MMNVFGGCVMVVVVVIVDVGIDCVDMIFGGVVVFVLDGNDVEVCVVFDLVLLEYEKILVVCCVVYLLLWDEIMNLWLKGSILLLNGGFYLILILKVVYVSWGVNYVVF